VEENRVKVLNVAGPRVSTEPDIGEFVMAVIDAGFTKLGFLAASPTSTVNDWTFGVSIESVVLRSNPPPPF
jgi:hypothetical protein